MKINKKIFNDRFENLLNNYKSGKILDIGNIGGILGKGKSNSNYLKFKNLLEDSKLYGIDLYSPPEELREHFDNQKIYNIENGLPYDDDFFDTIYAGQILEHIGNPLNLLLEINRVLKKEGIFIFDVPNPYSIERIIKWMLLRKEDLCDPTHLIFYTPASLEVLLIKSGFSNIRISTDWKQRVDLCLKYFKYGLGSHLIGKAKK